MISECPQSRPSTFHHNAYRVTIAITIVHVHSFSLSLSLSLSLFHPLDSFISILFALSSSLSPLSRPGLIPHIGNSIHASFSPRYQLLKSGIPFTGLRQRPRYFSRCAWTAYWNWTSITAKRRYYALPHPIALQSKLSYQNLIIPEW